jgi:hypothetical protein
MADLHLQPSIVTDLRSKALLVLINRLKSLDLSPILVYRIASLVDSAVLPVAWQWDVLNPLLIPSTAELVTLAYPSWDAVENIDALTNIDVLQYSAEEEVSPALAVLYAQYRALILLSTALHKTLGTPAAITNAFAQLGYPNVKIQEGQNSWGGTQWPSNEGWAVFRVLVNLAEVPANTDMAFLIQQATAVCNYWKPARCWLDSVQWQWYLSDTVVPAPYDDVRSFFRQHDYLRPNRYDFIVADAWPVSDVKTIMPLHNERYYHIGTTYGQNEPKVADSGVIVNGVAISANG